MDINSPAGALIRYLEVAHDAMRWKLDGLSDYDLRRPLTPTGTSLLGIVKHVAWVELGYMAETFDRPHDRGDASDDNDAFWDMYVAADESVDQIMALLDAAQAHLTQTLIDLPLDQPGHVPWWGDAGAVTLHRIAVHLATEINRHLGQIDILREGLDGATGLREGGTNMPGPDEFDWAAHVERLETIAREATGRS